MSRLVDACKAEIAILSHLAVLGAVDHHGLISGSPELGTVGVVDVETDCFAAEPVA